MACDVSPVAMFLLVFLPFFLRIKTGIFAKSARFNAPKKSTLGPKQNIATGETSQAITPFHFFVNSNFHH